MPASNDVSRTVWTEDRNTYQGGSYNKRTCSRSSLRLGGHKEGLIRAGNSQANDEDTANVENQYTPESSSDSNRNILSRILSLSNCYLNKRE